MSFLQTFTGQRYNLLDFKPRDVDIVDIAHSLAHQCRFGGHCNSFYSVAQHSVLVSQMCDEKYALWGLLHDASEAYCFDIPKPLKDLLPNYQRIEQNIHLCIAEAFGLGIFPETIYPIHIHNVDKRMLATEEKNLCGSEIPWEHTHEPYSISIRPLSPEEAKSQFISRFEEINGVLSIHGTQ